VTRDAVPGTGGDTDTGEGTRPLSVPDGSLRRARTVRDLSVSLSAVLDERLTGYLVVESGGAILLGDATRGVVTVAEGVPVLAYEVGTEVGGPDALAALAGPGPARVETYSVAAAELRTLHDRADCRVPPDEPARQLADDPGLAERTREQAPDSRLDREDDSALASFLADEERVAAIRTEARAEARRRAEEWGLDDELTVDDDDLAPTDEL
jgi:hypothetical protein